MRTHTADTAEEAIAALLARTAPALAASRVHAQTLDAEGIFPTGDIAALVEAGVLAAAVPTQMGGLGIGTEPTRATATALLLQAVGGGSVALGRIVEGHVNAIRLVMRNGDDAQRAGTAADARAGHLHALWVTDGPDPLRYTSLGQGIALHGDKLFCSAAGHATRAVVTANDPKGSRRLLLLPLQKGEEVRKLHAALQGVRSAGTGRVVFNGVRHDAASIFGAPEAYLREPEFSVGAWRASAVTAGALSVLVDAARTELVSRGRADNPEQRQRLGRMFINAETARLWVMHACSLGENSEACPGRAVATVNLARIAIEAACLDTIQLVQRSLGLSALMQPSQVERMCRDLATYLRQPAPDEALSDAAGYFATHPIEIVPN
jgi:alkylation response protein AidB-like acyl-CoA dehydrogenase